MFAEEFPFMDIFEFDHATLSAMTANTYSVVNEFFTGLDSVLLEHAEAR